MAMRNPNALLKYGVGGVVVLGLMALLASCWHNDDAPTTTASKPKWGMMNAGVHNTASVDSAAESLDTLTAELASTKNQVTQLAKDNQEIKNQNTALLKKMNGQRDATTDTLNQEVMQLKTQLSSLSGKSGDYAINSADGTQAITTVSDLTSAPNSSKIGSSLNFLGASPLAAGTAVGSTESSLKSKITPYYTIPSNATGVKDRLMTALVGRIPIKGVVTDPYPFKIVFSDDTLAANGLRVPHLKQMVVSGYTEGDLNLVSVRGWITSLTFVFDDGTISTTTSNNNDIGHFTKENALGYLSDAEGNPFIHGKLITNAPGYLAGNVALGAAQGAASAYAQSQTTSQSTIFGTSTSTVTGSPGKYVMGMAAVNAAGQAQQWWHDREEQSFDAVYVPTVDKDGKPVVVAVNFAKEIPIDYNPAGRKVAYANTQHPLVSHNLD
jgi:hypothetical protein